MRRRMVVALTSLIAISLLGPAVARGDCLQAAQKVHTRTPERAGCFVPRTGDRVDAGDGTRACAAKVGVYYYESKSDALAVARALGVDPMELGKVSPCKALWVVEPAQDELPPPGRSREEKTLYSVQSLADVAKGYRENARLLGPAVLRGTGTGAAGEAAAEVARILGQIVVSRATQAAYEVIGSKIRKGLGCDDDADRNGLRFAATCQALAVLRIQDIAMARQVLVRAAVSDVAAAMLRRALPSPAASPAKEGTSASLDLRRAVASLRPTEAPKQAKEPDSPTGQPGEVAALARSSIQSLLAAIGSPAPARRDMIARAIADEVIAFAIAHAARGAESPARALLPLILAGAATAKCRLDTNPADLADCPVSQLVDQLAEGVSAAEGQPLVVARSIARAMLAAISTTGADDDATSRARLAAVVSGLFDGVCHAVDPDRPLGCPPILDASGHAPAEYLAALSILRGVIEAAIDEDTNRLFASIAAAIPILATTEGGSPAAMTDGQRRALRLVSGVVQYAATYGAGKDASDEEKDAQRTKILESLTADMTHRTEREGDWIFSAGGSLGLVGGARFGSGDPIVAGPLSLSLGLGLQHVESGGLHVELGVLDLAQYLSFQKEPETTDSGEMTSSIVVRDPELPDALSPSLKVGLQWGRDVPLFVAGMVGYSPFYEFVEADGSESRRGAWNLGVVVGAYVPLLDAN